MSRNRIWIGLFCAALIAGCSGGTSEQAAESPDAAAVATDAAAGHGDMVAAATEMTVELGCGSCSYHMEGVEGCQTAAKVGDKTMLVQGDIDAHGLGLCTSPRNATVQASMEGDKLVVAEAKIEGMN